jgi:hypothetical protein
MLCWFIWCLAPFHPRGTIFELTFDLRTRFLPSPSSNLSCSERNLTGKICSFVTELLLPPKLTLPKLSLHITIVTAVEIVAATREAETEMIRTETEMSEAMKQILEEEITATMIDKEDKIAQTIAAATTDPGVQTQVNLRYTPGIVIHVA